MTILELTIEELGAQGDGLAHHGGTTIFVMGALKGERVRVDVEDNKNAVKRGELLEVLIPSSHRTTAPCPHFPQCGGCRLQHINDLAYTEFKAQQLEYTLLREKLPLPKILPPVITAARTRRRARVTAKRTRSGILIGFNEWRSHTIVEVHACPVVMDPIEALINQLRAYLPIWLHEGDTCDVQITVLDGGVDVVLIGGPKLDVNSRQAMAALASKLGVARLSWRKWDRSPVEPIAHNHPLFVQYGQTKVPFPPASFLQATKAGEEAMINFVCREDKPETKALDLFCGLGTFGLSLDYAKSVHFCDLDGPAVESLSHVATKNPSYSVSLRNLSVDAFTASECNEFNLVIFDPPRGGAKAQATQLSRSKVPVIMAISCDPPSFARDARILIEGGYKLDAIQPVDQFLWSPHLEIAAKFSKA